ncbi:hypothetical protein [Alkaliphilus peptidifermentans]|uniref:Uncharacterized protein n=1 Tax=Alkaliphilus peptidifermentans DSM 18978 TaxID=1120976 RepID=A0A1G5JZS0_9FIRM|nr:hypothetical protein [Alkaliphilus peptidifermentans]SCY93109.1 hypothetical protein SAMN03080606_03105 [Alkaliphilus peptidifermentans DSM 18978]
MPQVTLPNKQQVEAVKNDIGSINTKVGTNTDVGGNTTLFARLRQIYEYLTANMSSTRMSKVDSIDNTISSRQANWGATTTHRDRIDTTISSRQASWGATSTHSSRIDTTISSRASQASVDNLNVARMVVPSNTLRHSFAPERSVTGNSSKYILVAKFVPLGVGELKVTWDMKTNNSSNSVLMHFSPLFGFAISTHGWTDDIGSINTYPNHPSGVFVSSRSVDYVTITQILRVPYITPIYLHMAGGNSHSENTSYCRNINIYYDFY